MCCRNVKPQNQNTLGKLWALTSSASRKRCRRSCWAGRGRDQWGSECRRLAPSAPGCSHLRTVKAFAGLIARQIWCLAVKALHSYQQTNKANPFSAPHHTHYITYKHSSGTPAHKAAAHHCCPCWPGAGPAAQSCAPGAPAGATRHAPRHRHPRGQTPAGCRPWPQPGAQARRPQRRTPLRPRCLPRSAPARSAARPQSPHGPAGKPPPAQQLPRPLTTVQCLQMMSLKSLVMTLGSALAQKGSREALCARREG